MIERLGPDTFQARCACMRPSPILRGQREVAESALSDLDWKMTDDGGWRCPICSGRARTLPPPIKLTILLVEDDADARIIYGTTLRHVGYRVIEAPTLKDARAAVRGFLPDLVVLDCRLPDGDGLELVNTWRDEKMSRVPVIVVSAHRERQDLDAAVLAGADLFVPKPCPGDVLAAHIDRVVRRATPTRRVRAPVP